MSYEEFLDRLEQELLCEKKPEEEIRRVQILKNNGVRLDGFSCRIQGHREQPTVYVNHYYQESSEERKIEEVAALLLRIMRESILEQGEQLERLMDYPKMRDHIFYRLISREQNEELLETLPHILWLDLAIVFYLRIPEEVVKNATALIHDRHMEHWGLTTEELYRIASENMAGMDLLFHPMEQLLDEYGLGDIESGMYVLSNASREFGAAVIAEPEVRRMCARELGGDYYVLPSSVHEVILLPAELAVSREELDELVREVNKSCVSREEVLSGHAYRYSAKTGELSY